MQSKAETPDQYVRELPPERRSIFSEVRNEILRNLPDGFEEVMTYGMIGYVVPHLLYPAGYHVDPRLPLPFISLASQKNFIALYHLGLYADEKLLRWFTGEYPKYSASKLDMGKSCIRFKSEIPVTLIGELASKMSVDAWVTLYEASRPARA
jgi:hypothetical protein